jgi:hypothetical protein
MISARSHDVPKMITIGSVGSAPHIVKYTVTRGVYLFFFRTPTARTGIATWTIMPQSTQIFSRKCPFGYRDLQKIFRAIFAPKIEKILNSC